MYLYIFHLMCYNIYNYDFEDEYEKSFIAGIPTDDNIDYFPHNKNSDQGIKRSFPIRESHKTQYHDNQVDSHLHHPQRPAGQFM